MKWIAVYGLNRYGQRGLARSIAERPPAAPAASTRRRCGFGWNNGVLRKLMNLYH